MRRTAVHFWPAFCVMSTCTLVTNCVNVSSSTSTSGPSTAELIESASTLTRTLFASRRSLARMTWPVRALPVNPTVSCGPQ